jgi:hypothetical protein
MPNNKRRRLWLNVRFKVPPGTPREKVIETLLDSVQSGNYDLPDGWDVRILWRNRANAEMKSGPWKQELRASRRSSSGFDKAVVAYLEDLP